MWGTYVGLTEGRRGLWKGWGARQGTLEGRGGQRLALCPGADGELTTLPVAGWRGVTHKAAGQLVP